ncbi:DUF3164 family protein [Desulforegula conservatrix]|uniref:DUF3164 family protein n=1 Tax=Desulforegula conservatrix TaxID=153026 RepID=UPI00040199BC|nr:DUF3164 family protein [Desulforegula conservatrix]
MNMQDYREDHKGRLVPVNLIDEIDLERDSLVKEIIGEARNVNSVLKTFKSRTMADVSAFCELSAEKYGVKRGGRKGNLSLLSFDGKSKVLIAISENLSFDERLHAAKELIDECLNEWTQDSRPEIKVLINDAFQVDKEGNISTTKVLSLRRLRIEDERWHRAMDAISQSVQVADTKSYIRVYERGGIEDAWQPVSLDISAA